MARKWTSEQRAAQSKAVHNWKPWQKSTGPVTETGKATISRNAYRGGVRPLSRFACWICRAVDHPETLTPEIVGQARDKSVQLLSGNAGYMATAITKLIAECNLSEVEAAELQALAKDQKDFKNSLMQA